jgi:hypothetical protein
VFVAVEQDGSAENVAKSPKFRWRERAATPPESAEVVACLLDVERALAAAGWEPVGWSGEWCARQFRRRRVPLTERMSAYTVTPDESMIAWLKAQTPARAQDDTERRGEDWARVIAIRDAARQRELKRLEAERLESQRREAERLLARHQELERIEAERREQERVETRRHENERIESERLQTERLLLARPESRRHDREQLQAEQREGESLQTERAEFSTLHDRLSAYTGKVEPQVEIRASFGGKVTL